MNSKFKVDTLKLKHLSFSDLTNMLTYVEMLPFEIGSRYAGLHEAIEEEMISRIEDIMNTNEIPF